MLEIRHLTKRFGGIPVLEDRPLRRPPFPTAVTGRRRLLQSRAGRRSQAIRQPPKSRLSVRSTSGPCISRC